MDVFTSSVTFAPSAWLETSLIIRSSPGLLFLFLSPSIEPIFMDHIKSSDVIMSCLYLAYFVSQNLSLQWHISSKATLPNSATLFEIMGANYTQMTTETLPSKSLSRDSLSDYPIIPIA